MDEQGIYVKTAAGEAAMRRRERLGHRDLRTVLILVDGHASVGELRRQVGDANVVDNSLAELERLTLIEKRWVAPDATVDPSRASATAADAAPARPSKPPVRRLPAWLGALRARVSAWRQQRKAHREEQAFLRAYEMPLADDSFIPVTLKPIRRGQRRSRRWVVGGLAAGLLSVFLALLTVLLFPYGRYRAEVEQHLSAAFGQAVVLGDIRFHFLPFPHLALSDMAIGSDCDVKTLRLVPDLQLTPGGSWTMAYAQFEDVSLRQPGILASAHWFAPVGGVAPGIVVRRARLERLSLEVSGASLEGLSGDVDSDASGRWRRLTLQDAAHGLLWVFSPNATGYEVSVTGNEARISLLPDLPIDYVEARGALSADALRFTHIDARVFGGIVDGSAELGWSRQLQLTANLSLRAVSVARVAAARHADLLVDGEMSGKLQLQARAGDWPGLRQHLAMDGDFVAERGVIHRFDLMEALRGNRLTRGGQTRYRRMSGVLRRDNDNAALHVTQLKVDGGLLQAAGAVDIDSQGAIKGALEVELKGAAARFKTTVGVAGNLADPQLLSRRRDAASAAGR